VATVDMGKLLRLNLTVLRRFEPEGLAAYLGGVGWWSQGAAECRTSARSA
jgi:hypothetical protein